MLIKDQIRLRMNELGITAVGLAKTLNVRPMTVRHWLHGRSHPSKPKIAELEAALSCHLDFSEGQGPQRPDITSLLRDSDLEFLITMRKLPVDVRNLLMQLAKAYVKHEETAPFLERKQEPEEAREPFMDRPGPGERKDDGTSRSGKKPRSGRRKTSR